MNKLASVEKNIYFKAEREVMNGRVPHQASMLLRVALMIVGSTLLLGVSPTYSQQAQQDNTQTKKRTQPVSESPLTLESVRYVMIKL